MTKRSQPIDSFQLKYSFSDRQKSRRENVQYDKTIPLLLLCDDQKEEEELFNKDYCSEDEYYKMEK